MTYSKAIKPVTEAAISQHTPQIMALKEGDALVLAVSHPSFLRTYRDALYTWMHNNAIKQYYRISQASPIKLRITRLFTPTTSTLTQSTEIPFSTIERFVMDNLLEVNDEEALELILTTAIEEGALNPTYRDAVITEWRRFQGK